MILGQNHDFGACPHLTGDRLGDAAVTAGTGAPGRYWGAGALFFDLILLFFFRWEMQPLAVMLSQLK